MIYIEKSLEDPDIDVYKNRNKKTADGRKITLAERDVERAIALYGDPANFKDNVKLTNKKALEYEAYSHKNTKNELKKVFNGKCAYCESFIVHIEPGDIEHFRPKAEIHITGKKLIPGYYWLGADWKNLLLSCVNCNRPNKQLINGQGEEVLMGKANLFPLADETKRLRDHTAEITDEDPFVQIINPCTENPMNHLRFEDNGQVLPLDTKGEQSIAVYGLYRADLVHKRKLIVEQLDRTLVQFTQQLQTITLLEDNGLPIDLPMKSIETLLTEIYVAFDAGAEFLGIKRQKLARFIVDYPNTHARLLQSDIDFRTFL